MMRRVLCCALVAARASALQRPALRKGAAIARQLRDVSKDVATGVLAASVAFGAPMASFGAGSSSVSSSTQGFEDFAASGGVMEARPSCFANECGAQSKACFTNPSCLKGITCLGNCRGEQLCATRCFARFGSDKLCVGNDWLSCTLEENECVTTGAKQDTSAFYANPPPRLETFDPKDLDGRWVKVVGYSQKYDCFPCQFNTFSDFKANTLSNDIEFRVPKPNNGGFWQNRFLESMVNERGPQGKASLTVEGKMFHEQWYVLGRGADVAAPYVFVAYKGDTQQGPYDGAFLLMRDEKQYDASPALRTEVEALARANGIDPTQACRIDNTCANTDVQAAGASADDQSREKLAWRDVFDLFEWIRPGTLAKPADFDPNSMK